MGRKIDVGDIVKFKSREKITTTLGEVTQIYQITQAGDPGIIGQLIYVVDFDPKCEPIRIWDDLIIEVYRRERAARWVVRAGWEMNHDERIEEAKCSWCDCVHPTVYKTLDNLADYCPSCGRSMSVQIL